MNAAWVHFTLGETIYNVWVSGKKVKPLFFGMKTKKNKCNEYPFNRSIRRDVM